MATRNKALGYLVKEQMAYDYGDELDYDDYDEETGEEMKKPKRQKKPKKKKARKIAQSLFSPAKGGRRQGTLRHFQQVLHNGPNQRHLLRQQP